MGLPQLETCCFVFDLKTGNLIIGGINAFFSFVLLVIMIVTAATLGAIQNTGDPEIDAELTGGYVLCIILALMLLAKFALDFIFIFGVVTERAPIIKLYFIVWIVFFILSMFVYFLNITHFNYGITCTQIFYMGLNVYTILLSQSFYRQLNSREEV
ncbi:uncharacterized protein LOC131841197 [Achroia grisella]|uniref:uncharacterized protein LOC131841197 n=1 Tax=Achroia grisella TaxID=688607 RepID=UPI0027D34E8D|nr:uncharacterized protein LOC131841197 [Achroia grisella]